MEVQCLGLAEAMELELEPEVKRIDFRPPWSWLPPQLIPDPLGHLAADADVLKAPWPALLISSGRKSVAPAMAIRRKAAGATFVVQIQNPAVDPAHFDLVLAPAHDGVKGDNVFETRGALGRVTPERLAAAAEKFATRFAHLPRPRIAVLIGGNNRAYRLTETIAKRLMQDLAAISQRDGASVMVTASRRTSPGVKALLRQGLAEATAEIWEGEGENPYIGMLALADHVVVTGDSVNMISEAAATGRPVHVVKLEGGSSKFDRFHRAMEEAGITRAFTGELDQWNYEPLQEARRAAGEVRRRWPAAGPV